MQTFVSIIVVILGIAFLAFFCYEVFCLVRDVKKAIKKKKESKVTKEEESNDSK